LRSTRSLPELIFCLLCISSTICVASGINPHDKNFSGSWELDYQLSDHPAEKTRWLYTKARSDARRKMERAANQGRRVDTRVLEFNSIIGLGRLTEKIAQATVLTISQDAAHIVIERNDDFSLVCEFTRMNDSRGVIGAESCYWDEDQLVFEIMLPDGLRVVHRLSIAKDRSRLNIATTVRIAGVYYPYTLNRVYMPFEPGEGQYQCEFTVARQTTCSLRGEGKAP
jgi:hypothetical protein